MLANTDITEDHTIWMGFKGEIHMEENRTALIDSDDVIVLDTGLDSRNGEDLEYACCWGAWLPYMIA